MSMQSENSAVIRYPDWGVGELVLGRMNVSNVTLLPPVPTASVRPSERFSIGIVGPYGSFAVAPQCVHVGTGGTVPPHKSGTCTGPLHLLHVPIVGIFIPPGAAAQQFIQADAYRRGSLAVL